MERLWSGNFAHSVLCHFRAKSRTSFLAPSSAKVTSHRNRKSQAHAIWTSSRGRWLRRTCNHSFGDFKQWISNFLGPDEGRPKQVNEANTKTVKHQIASPKCESLRSRRVAKPRALLQAIGQGAICLLRSCSGWSAILNSGQPVPACLQYSPFGREFC